MTRKTGPNLHSHLDPFDTAILEFAERWAPFDGGHEFVFAEFGIRVAEFYDRLEQILSRTDAGRRDSRLIANVRRNYPFWRLQA